jgi:hypothetical protein
VNPLVAGSNPARPTIFSAAQDSRPATLAGSTKFAGSKFEHHATRLHGGPEGVERMEREIILPGPPSSNAAQDFYA